MLSRRTLLKTTASGFGYLAFAASGLPPLRQYGILSAAALLLAMLADFTALPAALWLVFRTKPASSHIEAHSHQPPPVS